MMSHFIQNLLARHIDLDQNVQPRVRGMYEGELDLVPSFRQGDVDDHEVDRRVPEFPAPKPVTGKKQTRSTEEHKDSSEGSLQKPSASSLQTHRPAQPNALHEQRPEDVGPVIKQTYATPKDLNAASKQSSLHEGDRGSTWPVRVNTKIYVARSAGEENQVERDQDTPRQNSTQDFKLGQQENDSGSTMKANVPELPYVPVAISAKRHDLKKVLTRPIIQTRADIASQVINVTIGRVEVRASLPAAEPKVAMPKENKASMSLDQYLDQKKSANR
jgi:hypothetical protein